MGDVIVKNIEDLERYNQDILNRIEMGKLNPIKNMDKLIEVFKKITHKDKSTELTDEEISVLAALLNHKKISLEDIYRLQNIKNERESIRKSIFLNIDRERERQNKKHPEFPQNPCEQYVILGEEFGEIGKAIQDETYKDLEDELIQTAAVCVRMVENIRLFKKEKMNDKVSSNSI